MRNPFTAIRRCRELENENLQLKSTCKDLRKQLENITAMRADYPGIEPCRSQRCLQCEHAVIRYQYRQLFCSERTLVGCSVHAKCEDFSELREKGLGR